MIYNSDIGKASAYAIELKKEVAKNITDTPQRERNNAKRETLVPQNKFTFL